MLDAMGLKSKTTRSDGWNNTADAHTAIHHPPVRRAAPVVGPNPKMLTLRVRETDYYAIQRAARMRGSSAEGFVRSVTMAAVAEVNAS